MEWSANLLVRHYRLVLIRAAYMNYTRIRFRADHLVDERVFFDKVVSQRERWVEAGGAIISYKYTVMPLDHDAILFVECPKFLRMMNAAWQNTKSVAVIYEPPTWKPHEEQIRRVCEGYNPGRLRRHLEELSITRGFVEQLPEITAQRLETLKRRAQEAASRSSSFPSLSGAGARLPDNRD